MRFFRLNHGNGALGQVVLTVPHYVADVPASCPPPGYPEYNVTCGNQCCSHCMPQSGSLLYAKVQCERLAKSDEPGLVYETKTFKGSRCPKGWDKKSKDVLKL